MIKSKVYKWAFEVSKWARAIMYVAAYLYIFLLVAFKNVEPTVLLHLHKIHNAMYDAITNNIRLLITNEKVLTYIVSILILLATLIECLMLIMAVYILYRVCTRDIKHTYTIFNVNAALFFMTIVVANAQTIFYRDGRMLLLLISIVPALMMFFIHCNDKDEKRYRK